MKKRRKCSRCRERGHYVSTCGKPMSHVSPKTREYRLEGLPKGSKWKPRPVHMPKGSKWNPVDRTHLQASIPKEWEEADHPWDFVALGEVLRRMNNEDEPISLSYIGISMVGPIGECGRRIPNRGGSDKQWGEGSLYHRTTPRRGSKW